MARAREVKDATEVVCSPALALLRPLLRAALATAPRASRGRAGTASWRGCTHSPWGRPRGIHWRTSAAARNAAGARAPRTTSGAEATIVYDNDARAQVPRPSSWRSRGRRRCAWSWRGAGWRSGLVTRGRGRPLRRSGTSRTPCCGGSPSSRPRQHPCPASAAARSPASPRGSASTGPRRSQGASEEAGRAQCRLLTTT